MRTPVLAAAAAVLLSGCLGALTEPVPQPLIYRLEVPAVPRDAAAGGPLEADLRVAVAEATPGLDGARIATRWPDRRLDYVAGARWAEELPLLVEIMLRRGWSPDHVKKVLGQNFLRVWRELRG